MRELERDVDESQHSSGVVCIVGHLRSFGERAVYESLRRNVAMQEAANETDTRGRERDCSLT